MNLQSAVCTDCYILHNNNNNNNNIVLYKNLSNEEKEKIVNVKECCECKREFGKEYKIFKKTNKVRHHNHFTGEYIATICESCNILEGHKLNLFQYMHIICLDMIHIYL